MTPIAVTIAGSDSSGGAGIQADLKTFAALKVYGASIITALTAQNTLGVQAIHDVPADFIAAQIDSVFSDLTVKAVKIGMLSKPAVIEAVAAGLTRHASGIPIILDPVMVATSGDRLISDEAVEAMRRHLLPLADLVTPNLPEAATLIGAPRGAERERGGGAGTQAAGDGGPRRPHQGRPCGGHGERRSPHEHGRDVAALRIGAPRHP